MVETKLKRSKFKTIKEFIIFDERYINDKISFRNVQVDKKSRPQLPHSRHFGRYGRLPTLIQRTTDVSHSAF